MVGMKLFDKGKKCLAVNLVGVAAESLDEFSTNKKKNIAPIVETVIDIKNTLTDTPFIESVARTGLETAQLLPDIIGNTAVVVSDLIKVRQIIGWNKKIYGLTAVFS